MMEKTLRTTEGQWIENEVKVVSDHNSQTIKKLIENHLKKLEVRESGWIQLSQDLLMARIGN